VSIVVSSEKKLSFKNRWIGQNEITMLID